MVYFTLPSVASRKRSLYDLTVASPCPGGLSIRTTLLFEAWAQIAALGTATVKMEAAETTWDYTCVVTSLELAREVAEAAAAAGRRPVAKHLRHLASQIFYYAEKCLSVEVFDLGPFARSQMDPFFILGEEGVERMWAAFQWLWAAKKRGDFLPFLVTFPRRSLNVNAPEFVPLGSTKASLRFGSFDAASAVTSGGSTPRSNTGAVAACVGV